ncbi:hypothetical protein Emed_004012 [Eimeria media]
MGVPGAPHPPSPVDDEPAGDSQGVMWVARPRPTRDLPGLDEPAGDSQGVKWVARPKRHLPDPIDEDSTLPPRSQKVLSTVFEEDEEEEGDDEMVEKTEEGSGAEAREDDIARLLAREEERRREEEEAKAPLDLRADSPFDSSDDEDKDESKDIPTDEETPSDDEEAGRHSEARDEEEGKEPSPPADDEDKARKHKMMAGIGLAVLLGLALAAGGGYLAKRKQSQKTLETALLEADRLLQAGEMEVVDDAMPIAEPVLALQEEPQQQLFP